VVHGTGLQSQYSLRKVKQACKFKASLAYIAIPCLKIQNKMKQKRKEKKTRSRRLRRPGFKGASLLHNF
jgi:hypothetical protein